MSVRVPVWVPSFDEVMAGRPASRAEKALLEACRTGDEANAGRARPEDTSDPARAVRAGLIRFLLLGGDEGHRPHPKGVALRGAWIEGKLDFQGCETHLGLRLFDCLIPERLVFRDAGIGGLYLSGSRLKGGADLHRIMVETSIALNKGFHTDKDIDASAARIGQQLTFLEARFDGSLLLKAAEIGNALVWKQVSGNITSMELPDTKVGTLHDDAQSWGCVTGGLKLNGFHYDGLHSEMTMEERLALLDRCEDKLLPGRTAELGDVAPFLAGAGARGFSPQPYSQLAKVLIAQGRREAAAAVLLEREWRLRRAEWLRYQAMLDGSWSRAFQSLLPEFPRLRGLCFRLLFGFGHRPWRALIWVLCYWGLATWFFYTVYDAGEFAPNSDVVLTSADWQRAVHLGCPLSGDAAFAARKAAGCVMPQDIWMGGLPDAVPPVPASTAAGDYETFSAWLYAADLFLPLDTIGQTEAWAPSKDRGSWGWWGYWLRFPIQLFGWIMVAMAAAVLAGVIGKKED